MQYAFYFDQTSCTECSTCTVACKDWNNVKPGAVKWRRIHRHEHRETVEGDFPDVVFRPLVYSCNHCAEPACVNSCPAGAISKRAEDGIVLINRKKCMGYQACVPACPYGAIQIADDSQEITVSDWQTAHPAQKCTFCLDRWRADKKPSCVMSCPQRALDAGPEDYIRLKYPEAVNADVVNGIPSGSAVKPSFYIKPRI